MFSFTQNSHGMSKSAADIVCVKSVAYEAVPHKPPIYDYVLVNGVHPKPSSGGSHYMELGPHPLDAPAVLPELDGKKVLYSDVKLTVSSADLQIDLLMHQLPIPLMQIL